jgi:hypothetical protein
MSPLRLFAIIGVFAAASAAWAFLGSTVESRTASLSQSLSEEVNNLWGPSNLVQPAPSVVHGNGDRADSPLYADPLKSDVAVRFEHHNRYKGLLWFSTYVVQFTGTYVVQAPRGQGQAAAHGSPEGMMIFRLPGEVEKTAVQVDGRPAPTKYSGGFAHTLLVDLPDANEHVVTVTYAARGRDRWSYTPVWDDCARPSGLRQFTLTASTNFQEIDYPKGSVSPVTPAVATGDGMKAVWQYDNDRTSKWVGIEMPRREDAGPIAARMSYFAPVSLLFYFTTLFTIVVLKKIRLHPMHYLFIAAGFFAFHILLAYLVDLISIHAAFWICAAVSVFLVVSYMRLVAGVRFALTFAALSQLLCLVGFSYAFFWAGKTGLTITIGAIVTLFVLMQATGRLDWQEVFKSRAERMPMPPAVIPPPLPTARPAGMEGA